MKSLSNNSTKEQGFTLIELLVVILIIGILSAIAVPAFLNQRKAANIASVQSDLKNAGTAMETALVSNRNAYPTAIPSSAVISSGVKLSLKGSLGDDPMIKDGWTKIDYRAYFVGEQPDTYTYMKLDGPDFIYQSTGPQFPEGNFTAMFTYKGVCTSGKTFAESGSRHSIVKKDTRESWGPQFCRGDGIIESMTIMPKTSMEHWPGYTLIADTMLYPAGSPLNDKTVATNKSYCIDGYHESIPDKPWRYDSVAGGIKEGKCS